MTASESIRSPVLAAALQDALLGRTSLLLPALIRLSGLPGKTPAWGLADTVGRFLADRVPASDRAIEALCRPRGPEAHKEASAFLPICAAAVLSRLAERGHAGALETLLELADDSRALVREGFVRALSGFVRDRADEALGRLDGWMTAYMPAAIVLEAVTTRSVLDRLRSPDGLVSRLDEGFALAEGAPRSDQRSQGYRLLVVVLGKAAARAMGRFPAEVGAMLERWAATSSPELRTSVKGAVEAGGRAEELGPIDRALVRSAPVRRDPRTYVGPTRRRGEKKKRRRG